MINLNKLNLEILNPYSGKNLSKLKKEERKLILDNNEKQEIENFAKSVILKSQNKNK